MNNDFEQRMNKLRQDVDGLDYISKQMAELAQRYNVNVEAIRNGVVEFEREVEEAKAIKANVVQAEGIIIDHETFAEIFNVLIAAKNYKLCDSTLIDKLIDIGKDQTAKKSKVEQEHKCSCGGNCSSKEQPNIGEQFKFNKKSEIDMEDENNTLPFGNEQFVVNLFDAIGKAFGGVEDLGHQIVEEFKKNQK